tara:strand:- start:12828 stop:14129 length:1302 start_codon:yes stop_codon:yes gene_type:complete
LNKILKEELKYKNYNVFSFDKLIFFIAYITPLPIFLDVKTFKPIIVEFNRQIAYSGIPGDIPVPIGYIATVVFITIALLKTGQLNRFIKIVSLLFLVFCVAYNKFGYFKILAILSPLIFLFGFKKIILSKFPFLKEYSYGYLAGSFSFLTVNLVSFLSSVVFDQFNSNEKIYSENIKLINNIDLNFTRHIFGIEIYQYYISVASIISLIMGIAILLLINNKNNTNLLEQKLLFATGLMAMTISILTLRKTSFLYLIFLIILFLLNKMSDRKVRVSFWISLTSFFSLFCIFLISSTRIINFKEMTTERPYLSHINDVFSNRTITELLFGSTPSFGGFSNLILELIYISGIVGAILYLAFLFGLLKRIYKIFSKRIDMKLILIFIFSNIFIENMLNLNLTQSYYSCNLFSCLIMAFVFCQNRETDSYHQNLPSTI